MPPTILRKKSFDEYDRHVCRLNDRYRAEYETFAASLTDEERQRINGCSRPKIEEHDMNPRHFVLGGVVDVAESYAASVPAPVFQESEVDEWMEQLPSLSRDDAERLEAIFQERMRRESVAQRAADLVAVVCEFLDSDNLRIKAASLAFAVGLPVVHGFTGMSDWAAAHGVTRAAVSKSANVWRRRLGLPPSHFMMKEENCEIFREAQLKKNHWRQRRLREAV
jgi:hypothetical protein